MADRRTGVGCDQLIVVEPPRKPLADAFMRIRNADGGEVAACGNATRCVAPWSCARRGIRPCRHRDRGRAARRRGGGATAWSASTWGRSASTGAISRWPRRPIPCTCRWRPGRCADAVGGQHRQSARRLLRRRCRAPWRSTAFGPLIERHPLFPERTNVERRRGAGSRPAAAARLGARRRPDPRLRHRRLRRRRCRRPRRGLTDRTVTVVLDGGALAHRVAARRPRADDRSRRHSFAASTRRCLDVRRCSAG